MPLRATSLVRSLLIGTALAGISLGFAGAARAQVPSYVPLNITPVPDVYVAVSLHPELLPLFGIPVVGQFRTLTVIGDSFADFGNALRAFTNPITGAVLLNPATGIPVVGPSTETGRFGNYLNSIDALQYRFAIPTSNVTNYAVGGAGNGTINAVAPGFLPGIPQQIDALVASGRRFGAYDLVAYTTTGGNDALVGVPAAISTANLVNNVQRLISLGARTLVLTGTGSEEYNLSQRAGLTRFANSGTRLFFLDLVALGRQVSANPAAYGFTNVTTICRPTPLSTPCAPTIATQNQFLMWDGVHLTTSGNAYIGAYEANQVNAPSTVAAQAELGQIAGASFAIRIRL